PARGTSTARRARVFRHLLVLIPLLAPPAAVAAACDLTPEPSIATIEAAIPPPPAGLGADGRWLENAPLPYRGEWLDTVGVLSGLTQQDRLRSTRHDLEKCGAMVASAAAITGGPDRFQTMLDSLDTRARGH